MDTMHEARCLDLAGVEWDAAWRKDFAGRAEPADVSKWNKRASSYAEPRLGDYEREFLDMLDAREGDTVLDFGCGPGILAVPLAQRGCKVVAADYSERMLAETQRNAEAAGVSSLIECVQVAWDDDWCAAGIDRDSVDLAVASRSLATPHLANALRQLDRTARRSCLVSLAAGNSPRRDERAYGAVGRERLWVPDYAYCMNILFEYGVFPTLEYIVTRRRPAFSDRDEALAELVHMMEGDGGPLDGRERAQLEEFLDEHYDIDPDADPSRRYTADATCCMRWACIGWGTGADR